MLKKNILIYGATGSIGESTLNLIRNHREKFNVVGLTCNKNIQKVIDLSKEFHCKNIGIGNIKSANKYKSDLSSYKIHRGIEEFYSLVIENDVDIIIFAISGTSPLNLLMQLALSGKIIGLANKECIICLGRLFLDRAKTSATNIVPLDSEHNAIFQLIKNRNLNSIKKYTITASGGNFYNYSYQDLKKITPEQAITHPRWDMGSKITVDSSTLMNKGLEIIEACILFDIDANHIDALIHPESIVHGLVEFNDTSTHAFLSQPTMEISISSVLFDDNNVDLNKYHLDLKTIKSLNFYEVDDQKFNAINLAKKSLDYSGLAPSILNYTNELMVSLFLQKKILFTDIVINNEKFLDYFIANGNNKYVFDIDDIKQSFAIVDEYAQKYQLNN
jgi:1-deoxy-D-xylulose-5-phosphate reductoisomerase